MRNYEFRVNPFDPEGLILVEQYVIDQIRPHLQLDVSRPEAGGILLGYRRGPHLHVTDLTLPISEDKATRTAFYRSASGHQEVATALWKQSNGKMDYLGEWHTHPQEHPFPSFIDTKEWRLILSRNRHYMVFFIAGNESSNWIGIGNGNQIAETMPAQDLR